MTIHYIDFDVDYLKTYFAAWLKLRMLSRYIFAMLAAIDSTLDIYNTA